MLRTPSRIELAIMVTTCSLSFAVRQRPHVLRQLLNGWEEPRMKYESSQTILWKGSRYLECLGSHKPHKSPSKWPSSKTLMKVTLDVPPR